MDDFIISGNIKRFERMLKGSQDEREQKVLRDLLADERRRLGQARSLEHRAN